MPSNFVNIESRHSRTISDAEIELVERKGKGHPDSLIDGACEAVSVALCKYYQDHYDLILHHNVDKGLLVGGKSSPIFGGGEVNDPIYVGVAGRAVSSISKSSKEEIIPVTDIAIDAMRDFLNSAVRFLNVDDHIILDSKIKQGSADLVSVYKEPGSIPLSNDTSFGVGFAPLTPTEKLVLDSELYLNSDNLKSELPEVGEDIKVMAYRKNNHVNLTIAAAGISSLIPDADHYDSVITQVTDNIKDLAINSSELDVSVNVNTGDLKSQESYYLTVTGTSAEAGDDGNTGRGNRPTGLITPMREYSMEATAGKNPVSHTGKIFSVVAQSASERIANEVKGVREIYVRILSQIGAPINVPQTASASVVLDQDSSLSSVSSEIDSIIREELSDLDSVTNKILSGSVTLF